MGGQVQAAQDQNGLVELLAQLGRLNHPDACDDPFEPALEAMTQALRLDAAAVLMLDDTARPRCRATRALSPEARAAIEERLAARGPGHADEWLWQSAGAEGAGDLTALAAGLAMASVGHLAITGQSRAFGHFVFFSRAPRPPCAREAALAGYIAAQLGHALDAAELRASQQRLLKAAEQSADRMRRLGRVAGALSSVPTARDVCTLVIDETHEALGADWTGVWLLDEAGGALDVIAARGGPAELRQSCASYPIAAENPLCLAVRTNQSMWLETWQDFAQRFPASEARVRDSPPVSFGCLPLHVDDRMIGGLVLTFFKQRSFSADERAFMNLFAQHCAQGIERARLYDRALDAIRVRDDFLSVAGHELRTPLSTLLLQTQSMVDASDDPTAGDTTAGTLRERLAPVYRSLRRLIRLADDVLDVSRIRAGRLRIEPEPLDLVSLVRDVATRTVEGARRSRNELRLEGDDAIEGRWDPVRLEQIVVNLVSNACKYGVDRPIDVRVARCPGGATIVVRDHGIGIAAADQARIFERFERVETRAFAGLGLGLWIVRELVQLHGGRISVRSDLGEGAEFSVILPLNVPGKGGAP